MPWKETQKMDQRIEFAMKALHCDNFSQLCNDYGISRKTGYKWRERFLANGTNMGELSRRPGTHANQLSESVVCDIIALKNAHPHWGPLKIRELYRRQHRLSPGHQQLPSESSFKRVLERAGLTQKRITRKRAETGRLATQRQATEPNQVWTVDFKGWWRERSGKRVEPLTVRDEHSRFILELRAVPDARSETVRASFERLFETHGLPEAIRSDNGPPFASSNAILGLSRLSVWWLANGIDLERGRPGCPQDNGAHERMHRDIRAELQAGQIGRDQAAFDLWREEFNTERPHQALEMATPAEVYRPSSRPWPGTPEQLDYQGMETRRVSSVGGIKFGGQMILISTSLAGWDLGLGERRGDEIELWFAHLLLGHLNARTFGFRPVIPNKTSKR